MARIWLLLKKKEMTRVYVDGKMMPITLLQLMPQKIVRHKTQDVDGYSALVVWVGENDAKQQSKKYDHMFEVRDGDSEAFAVDAVLDESLFEGVSEVKIQGISKGKGFQGMMKRHGASGMPATHGHKFTRVGWSKGNRKPRRVLKWHPEAGHMGDEKKTLSSVSFVGVYKHQDEVLVGLKGSLPGSYNGLLRVYIK